MSKFGKLYLIGKEKVSKYNIQDYKALIRLFMVHISESWLEYKQKDSRSHKNEIVKIIVGNQQRLGFLMSYNSSSQIV